MCLVNGTFEGTESAEVTTLITCNVCYRYNNETELYRWKSYRKRRVASNKSNLRIKSPSSHHPCMDMEHPQVFYVSVRAHPTMIS
jgi:hypothetical protein